MLKCYLLSAIKCYQGNFIEIFIEDFIEITSRFVFSCIFAAYFQNTYL